MTTKDSAGNARKAESASPNPVAAPLAPARRRHWWPPLLLLLILLVGFGLRLGGLTWGVPSEPHYRNYYQDERFVLELLFHMDPARLDFDPHYYINPSLHYYALLATIEAASLFGLKLHLPVKGTEPLRPASVPGGTYRALFLVGRLLVIVEGALSVLLMYLIARELYDERTGLLAALLFAVNYPCMYQAHFFTTDGPALFWLILGLYFVVRLFRKPTLRVWQVLAPIGIGLAVGAKYLNLLLVVPYLYVLFSHERNMKSHRLLRRAGMGALLAVAAFLVTTPYSLLSFSQFLHGNRDGFGGIFGARGLMFYNNFPPSLLEPYAVTSRAALGLLGLLALALALVVLFKRRRASDVFLLCFIVPFYVMLMCKSSPQLRHILPVLPFVIIAMAGTLTGRKYLKFKTGAAGMVLLGTVALSWLGLSLAAVQRMCRPDTRVQAEDWVKHNVTTETIALPTYNFIFRYTPAIDSFHLLPLYYDAGKLEDQKPEYLLMVEPEYRLNGRNDYQAALKTAFVSALDANRNYLLFKAFTEPFTLSGLRLKPCFPTEDWNDPSPEIKVYRRAGQSRDSTRQPD